MLQNYWKFLNRNVQTWIRLTRHKRPKSWSSMEDPVVPLWKESVWSSFSRTNMGKAIWESPSGTRLGANSKLGMFYSLTEKKKELFLSVCVDDIKLAGKKQNINPMWKVLNNEVDLGEPTSFLDTYLSGVGSELTFFLIFFLLRSLFVTVGFVYSW